MATVTNTIELPDGSTPSRAAVEIRLLASETAAASAAGWVTATDITVLSVSRPTVTAGAWSADLVPNANITPSSTVYRVDEFVGRDRYVHFISVGAGGGSVFDLLTDPPGALASSALQAHISSGGHAATAITVADAGSYFAGGTVEAVLQELGARVATPPVSLTDGATIALNAALGTTFRVTLGGARTLSAPTNPTDGQSIELEITQDSSGSRTLTLPTGAAGFAFGTDAPSSLYVLSTTAGVTDYLRAKYSSTRNRWHVLAFIRGFSS